MLSVTDEALKHLAEVLDENNAPEGALVRCVAEDEELALVIESSQPDDTIYKLEDRPVLGVSIDLVDALADREFDLDSDDEGPGLTLR